MLTKYRVTGNIVSGAFIHTVWAHSADEAIERVNHSDLSVDDLDMVASERSIAIADSAEEEQE